MRNKQFIIHVQLTSESGETEIPIFAKDLDEALEWAEKTYEDNGIQVNRIRSCESTGYFN